MNSQSGRLVFNQMALWAVLVAVVGLLTLLFSLLGTISCAVIVGVMMGASRRWRWQTLPISIVFPAVIVTLSRVSKTELDWRQTMQMALLCFGVFWATHLVTYLLMFLERPPENPAPNNSRTTTSASEPTKPAKVAQCCFEDLRGKWHCETTAPDGQTQERIMTIGENEFSLSQKTPDGQRRLIAQGKVEWVGTRQPKALVIHGSEGDVESKDS